MRIHGVSRSARISMPSTKRSLRDPFLTKGCSRDKHPVTREPKGIATVLYEPAKAGCMQSLAVDNSPWVTMLVTFCPQSVFLARKVDCGVWPKTGRRVGAHQCDSAALF